jgi:uncharacterized membrane protein YcaP (DUF421 family)
MLEHLIGTGPDLDTLQMSVRAIVVFFVALAIVRLGGMRAFGARSPFDTIVAVLLGGVLSRAVVGTSPLVATCLASTMFAFVHRALAMLGARLTPLARMLNGSPHRIYHDGQPATRAMLVAGISARDLDAAARRARHTPVLSENDDVWLETNGELSIVRRPAPGA